MAAYLNITETFDLYVWLMIGATIAILALLLLFISRVCRIELRFYLSKSKQKKCGEGEGRRGGPKFAYPEFTFFTYVRQMELYSYTIIAQGYWNWC